MLALLVKALSNDPCSKMTSDKIFCRQSHVRGKFILPEICSDVIIDPMTVYPMTVYPMTVYPMTVYPTTVYSATVYPVL